MTEKKPRQGVPCSEASLKEHKKAFTDMEECFVLLNKTKKKTKK